MAKTMLFGTVGDWREIPCPLTGMESPYGMLLSATQLLDGRQYIRRSTYSHKVFKPSWLGSVEALQPILDMFEGEDGNGPYYFLNPMVLERNVLPAQWAAPYMLGDWESVALTGTNIQRSAQALAQTDVAIFKLPKKFQASVTRSVAKTTAELQVAGSFVVPIPAGTKVKLAMWASTAGLAQPAISAHARNNPGKENFVANAATWGNGITSIHKIAELSGDTYDAFTLHWTGTSTKSLYGLAAHIVPASSTFTVDIWSLGKGQFPIDFDDTPSVTNYMSGADDGRSRIGISSSWSEV